MSITDSHPYHLAQRALADLKGAVYLLLRSTSGHGLSNAQIGRGLGIYAGHVGHEGHISRTLLEMMRSEGVVHQDPTSKRWFLKEHTGPDEGEVSET